MRIVHITNAGGFGRTQRGGAERAVDELSSELARSFGWEEHVIAPPEFFAGGNRSESVNAHPVELGEFGMFRSRRRDGEIASVLREIDPDVVMTHLLRGTLVGLPLATRFTRAKRVSVLHATLSDYERQPGHRKLKGRLNRAAYRRAASRMADLNIAISEVNRADLVSVDRLNPDLVLTIHNWVSTEFDVAKRTSRDAVRAGIDIGTDTPLALIAGRLEAEKNPAFAIELLVHVPELALVLAGDGALRGELEALALRLGVQARVRFLGHRSDVPDLMAAADIVLVPSLFEAFGRSIVEAIAVGTPVVANRLPAVEEVLDGAPEGAAKTIPLDDQASWIEVLSAVASGEVTPANPETLADFARRRYSLEAAAARYDFALRSLVDGSPATQVELDAIAGRRAR